MPNVTIIGTSHAAAYKQAWDDVAGRWPEWQVRFFAATARNFRSLHLMKPLMFGLPAGTATTDPLQLRAVKAINNATQIDLSESDLVLRVGFRQPLRRMAEYLLTHDVEVLFETGRQPRVSRAEFDSACDSLAQRDTPPDAWQSWARPKLVLANRPLPSETMLTPGAGGLERARTWLSLVERGADPRAAFFAFLDRYEAHLARAGIALLRQPAETVTPQGLTLAEFSAGSKRLRTESDHPTSDHRHMNTQFGELMLASFFDGVGATAQAEAKALGAEPAILGQDSETRPGGGRVDVRAATAPTASPSRRATGPEGRGVDAPLANSPYAGLPPRAYWRTGVAERAPLDPGDIFLPRIPITRETRVVTAGSCFAQVLGRAIREAGFTVVDAETLPSTVSDESARSLGYRIFSARYGNIYTARQLVQLFDEAEGAVTPALPVWRKGERFFDAQRPNVEPEGLESEELVLSHRAQHLAAVREVFRAADLFVFTFGLTEAWTHAATGTVYPTAPGTIAGDFDPEVFALRNFDAIELLADFERFRIQLKAINPSVRFLVTTSPVPMTATASGEHIEVANCYSKSTLRAVCGMLKSRHQDIDYFPGYELITSQNARGAYYGPNQRNVSAMGVKAAMGTFLTAHGIGPKEALDRSNARKRGRGGKARRDGALEEVECEESLLEAFAR